jgi:hypothetical protein
MIKITNTEHPRLFVTKERITELKNLEKSDRYFAELKKSFILKAEVLLATDVVPFKITGPRMLKNCQEIRSRVAVLALAYLLTDEMKFATRAKYELLSAASFPHWNKDHFLDTAELITAFAIGYDWLYHALPAAELELIKQTMIRKGINEGLSEHKNNIWWAGHKYNWNQVCNGGMIIGSLAIAAEEPQLCSEVFDATTKFLPIAFDSYGKDGGWEAGPDYWQYTTLFSALLVDALQMVTKNDFGLSKTKGFDKTGLFPIYMSGANDRFFNFADADEKYPALPVLFWLGKQFKLDACINENHRLLKKAVENHTAIDAFNLVWYVSKIANVPALPTSRLFSEVNVGSMRGDWTNPKSTFIGFKGGFNQADHAHLDLGTFVLDMKGERFCSDLGRDNYDLPGYFDLSEGGGRWEYFRLNTKSHNTLILNADIQRANASAMITEMTLESGATQAKVNLSEAYLPHASSVLRTFRLATDESIEIVDEIIWAGSDKHFRWQILTDASINFQDRSVVLVKNDQSVMIEILQPQNIGFKSETASKDAPQSANDGYLLLFLEGPETGAKTHIKIRISNLEK